MTAAAASHSLLLSLSSSSRQRIPLPSPSSPCMRIGSSRSLATTSRRLVTAATAFASVRRAPTNPHCRIIGQPSSGLYPTFSCSSIHHSPRRFAHSGAAPLSRPISTTPSRKCDDSPAAMSAAAANYTGSAKLIDGTAIAKYVSLLSRRTQPRLILVTRRRRAQHLLILPGRSARSSLPRSMTSRPRKSLSRPPCWPSSSLGPTLRPRHTFA